MKVEHPSAEQLHLCYDGELPAREAAELRLHVASCTQCQSYMGQLERLGQFVKLATADAQASVAEPDFDRAFGTIERALQLDQVGAAPASAHVPRTSSLREKRETQAARTALTNRTRRTERAEMARRWLQRGAPTLGAVALAAAALLMVYRQDGATLTGETTETATNEAGVLMGHSEIVDVDFGSNAGQVFDIPMSDGSSIPVVWIDDDDDDEE